VNHEIYNKVRNNPKYVELVKKRSSFAWMLSSLILIVYYTFIMIIAFYPSLLGNTIGNGVTTIGMPIGLAIIFLCFLLTGIYTKRANKEFDKLTDEIKEDIRFDA